MKSDTYTQPDSSELTNGLPKQKAVKEKADKKSEYTKGRRDAALETRDAMLTAKESVVNMYETLAMTQMRQMMNQFVVEAGKKLADAEVAQYKLGQLLSMAGPGGPPPLPGAGMPPGMPPPLPVEMGGMPPGGMPPELPPDLAAMGGGGGAPPMALPPDGSSMPLEMMGMPPGGMPPMG